MIVLESLTKSFGTRKAIDGLTLEIPAGEILGYLGPNGAGKTTTQRILMGLLHPSGGRASIGGFDATTASRKVREITGFMPDTPYLYEFMTARQFLAFIAEVHGLSAQEGFARVRSTLEKFELIDRLETPLSSYSYGMSKKITLAALLSVSPRALLLDEPTTGMDPRSVRVMKDLVQEEARKGTAILLSTHTLSVAEEICDRVAILSHGRILTVGAPRELSALARSPTKDLESLFLELTEQAARDAQIEERE